MATDLDVDLILQVHSQQLQQQLQQALSGPFTIGIAQLGTVQLSPQALTGVSTQVQTALNNTTFTLNNFNINTNNLVQALQNSINNAVINLQIGGNVTQVPNPAANPPNPNDVLARQGLQLSGALKAQSRTGQPLTPLLAGFDVPGAIQAGIGSNNPVLAVRSEEGLRTIALAQQQGQNLQYNNLFRQARTFISQEKSGVVNPTYAGVEAQLHAAAQMPGQIGNTATDLLLRLDQSRQNLNQRLNPAARPNPPPRTFMENLSEPGVRNALGYSALVGASRGSLRDVVGGLAGGAIGGGIFGTESAAAKGGAIGIGFVESTLKALSLLKDSLFGAAAAGLTFQRSILGISAVNLQSSEFIGPGGNPLGLQDQVRLQGTRARKIQLAARRQAADVGIGGEAESSIVQSIITAAGAKGIQLDENQTATLTSRLGAALNIFAPELSGQPNIVRRDIFDIIKGVPQAGRTAVGSRIPQVVEQLKEAKTGDQLVRATNQLEQLVQVFKNSDNALTNIQRFNALVDITKTNFGEAIVDKISPALKSINELLNSEQLNQGLVGFGHYIGEIANQAGKFAVGTIKELSQERNVGGFKFNLLPSNEGALAGGLTLGGAVLGGLGGGLVGGVPGAIVGSRIGAGVGTGAFLAGESLLTGGSILDTLGAEERGLNTDKFQSSDLGFADNSGRFRKRPVNLQTRPLVAIEAALRRGGLKEDELTSLNVLGEQGPEFELSKLREGTASSRRLLEKGFNPNANLTEDIIRGRLFSGNRGIVSRLGAIDKENLANALPTLAGQEGALRGSNISERIDVASQNLGIAKQSGDVNIIAQAERELAKARKESFEITSRLKSVEVERAELQARSVDRISFRGRESGFQADRAVLTAKIEAEQDQEKRQTLIAERGQFDKRGETRGLESLKDFADLGKNVISTTIAFATLGDKVNITIASFESAAAAVDDFTRNETIATLTGEEKLTAIIQQQKAKGVNLTGDQELALSQLGLNNAVFDTTGGPEDFFRTQKLGQNTIDQEILNFQRFKSKNQRAGRESETRINFANEFGKTLGLPFDAIDAFANKEIAGVKAKQFTENGALNIGTLTQSLVGLGTNIGGLTTQLTTLVERMGTLLTQIGAPPS